MVGELKVSADDGLMISTNTGTISVVPGTLPSMARSWNLLLEEVSIMLWRGRYST